MRATFLAAAFVATLAATGMTPDRAHAQVYVSPAVSVSPYTTYSSYYPGYWYGYQYVNPYYNGWTYGWSNPYNYGNYVWNNYTPYRSYWGTPYRWWGRWRW
ncbi:MAG TPA: hypothetical protein VLM40_10405 [Gemmata sp.]|nr:hypothetical protein [Gemmata sp.]